MSKNKNQENLAKLTEVFDFKLVNPPRVVPTSLKYRLFSSRLSTHFSFLTIGCGLWLCAFGWKSLDFSKLSLQGDNLGKVQAQVTKVEELTKVNEWHYRFTIDGTLVYNGIDYLNKNIPVTAKTTVEYSRRNPSVHRMSQSVLQSYYSVLAENMAIIIFVLLWLFAALVCIWALFSNFGESLKWQHLLHRGLLGRAVLRKKPPMPRTQAYMACEFQAQDLEKSVFKVNFDIKNYNELLPNKEYPMLYDAEQPSQRCVWLELPQPIYQDENGQLVNHWQDYQSTILLMAESVVIIVVFALIIR